MFNLSLQGRLFLFVLLLALTTMAEVKKEFGEFTITHSDFAKDQLILERHYSSRSLFKGFFGFNWCSYLDYRLNFDGAEINMFDCELGRSIKFKKIAPNRFRNEALNLELAEKNFQWHLVRPRATLVFSSDGRIKSWVTSRQTTIYLEYKEGSPYRLLSKKTGPLLISFSAENLIRGIGTQLSYHYTQNLLERVNVKNKPKWKYQYDEFLNMTLWRGPSAFESMKYDSEWDRIIFLKDQNDCRFHFQYEVKNSKKFIIESKKCLNTAEQETQFEVTRPTFLIKAPSDQLGKEFRQGANNEIVF